jgi:hypothetical protein
MANEIIIIEEIRDRAQIVFLYPVASPIQVAGQNVVPSPTTNAVGDDALGWTLGLALTAQEKLDLDAGDLVFERLSMRRLGDNNAAFLVRIQARYATRSAAFTAFYATRYAQAGARFNP